MTWGGSAAPFLDCTATPPRAIALNYSPSYNVCAVAGHYAAGDDQRRQWFANHQLVSNQRRDAYLNNPFVANPSVNIPAGVSGTFQYTIMVDQAGCMEEATITVNASATPCPPLPVTISSARGRRRRLRYRRFRRLPLVQQYERGPSITVGRARTPSR